MTFVTIRVSVSVFHTICHPRRLLSLDRGAQLMLRFTKTLSEIEDGKKCIRSAVNKMCRNCWFCTPIFAGAGTEFSCARVTCLLQDKGETSLC